MKIKITALLLFITAFSAQSQTIENLKAETEKMYQATFAMDFDKIFSYTYPKLFETVPTDELKTIMEQAFDNEYMKITLEKVNPAFKYSPLKEVDGKKLSLINYKTAMTMVFKQSFDTDEAQQSVVEAIKASGKFSTVTLKKEQKAIYAEMESVMIGISDTTTGNKWKFVNYDASQAEMAKTILGENVLKALGL
ncbi:MAG: hypothetical protein PSV16_09175 [Flavobacterium sp.]|nr:hypothetical protein [Flavobacterium sp.]